MRILYLIILIITSNVISAQNFDKNNSLKSYSKSTILTSQVRSEGNKAILRGTEANNNSGETLTKMGHLNGTSQLKTDTGGFFKRPPFYVLLYNKIWEILNPGQGVHQYLDYSE